MTLSIVWLDEAESQLLDILSYIADRNPTAAARINDLIEEGVNRAASMPYLYRRGRVEGTREAVVHPNYIVVYKVTSVSIEITGVIHARRQYP